jgi:hypothetical protein
VFALENLDHHDSVLRTGWPNDELEELIIEIVLGGKEGDDSPAFRGLSFVECPWEELEDVILCDGNVLCDVCSERGLSG